MKRFFRMVVVLCSVLLVAAAPVYAGVLQVVKDVAGAVKDTGSLTTALVAAVLLAVFRIIPNDLISKTVEGMARAGGIVVTLGMSRFKFTAPFWNTIIEPWFIDFIDNTIGALVRGFIAGLRTDNGGTEDPPGTVAPGIETVIR